MGMRYLLAVVLVALVGCAPIVVDHTAVLAIVEDVGRLPSVKDVDRWGADVWQPPEYTEANGGDCEDKAILAMVRLADIGIPSVMAGGFYVDVQHAWIEVDGVGYDPYLGLVISDDSTVYTERWRLPWVAVVFAIRWDLQ